MKIMFTNSPLHFSHGHTFTQPDWQTLVLPYLAGIVGDKQEVSLLDNMNYSFWKSNNILEQVGKQNPDIVGFSIIASRDIFNTLEAIKTVKKTHPDKTLIAGGQAGTYYNELLLKSGIDFVVHREGEVTLKELIESLEDRSTDFSQIRGISYLDGEEVKYTGDRENIKDLDLSPIPRFDLMPKIKSKWFKGRYTGSIEMSRGCPFNCNFCAIAAFWERSYRQRSNERILEELGILKQQGRTHIYLADDNFAMDARKMEGLLEEILKRNLDMKFFAQIRADTVAKNPEMIALAAKAGLYGVLVGFDTYNPETFDSVTKTTSEEQNILCSDILRKNKIAIFGTHIYGLPDQKKPEDFERTFQLGRKYSDLFRMPYFSPLPFTKGYEEAVQVNPNDEKYKQDFRPRIGTPDFQKLMQKGYDRYTWRHNLSFSEISGALFHPDPVVRTFKRMGYVSLMRHKLYRYLRKFGLTDI